MSDSIPLNVTKPSAQRMTCVNSFFLELLSLSPVAETLSEEKPQRSSHRSRTLDSGCGDPPCSNLPTRRQSSAHLGLHSQANGERPIFYMSGLDTSQEIPHGLSAMSPPSRELLRACYLDLVNTSPRSENQESIFRDRHDHCLLC